LKQFTLQPLVLRFVATKEDTASTYYGLHTFNTLAKHSFHFHSFAYVSGLRPGTFIKVNRVNLCCALSFFALIGQMIDLVKFSSTCSHSENTLWKI